jgi:TonB family protein
MCGLTTRMNALAITVTLHAAVFGLAIYGWQHASDLAAPRDALTVTVLTPQQDEAQKLPKPGRMAPKKAPEPATIEVHPAPRLAVSPMVTVVANPTPAAAAPEGGRNDELAQITQAYRQTLTARLERARAYPQKLLLAGRSGEGLIWFRIDRTGRLIEAVVEGSTGSNGLDRAAMRIVRRAAPFPPIPAQLPDELTITLPLSFLILTLGDDAPAAAR